MTGDNCYVVIVSDEPVPGVPSLRIYGFFPTARDGWETLARDLNYLPGGIGTDGEPTTLKCGVLPLRRVQTLREEKA